MAANVQADLLILMSDVDGIYNKPPWEDGARMMHTYTSQDRNTIEFGQKSKVRIKDSTWHRFYEYEENHAITLKFLFFCTLKGRHWWNGLKGECGHMGFGPWC